MGINGAHELSHSVNGLSIQDILTVCLFIRRQRGDSSNPTIDLDASLLYHGSKLSVDNRMRQLMDVCCQLSSVGFTVVVICDGAVRHYTKRASVQRQAIVFANKVKSYLLCIQLMGLMELKKTTTEAAEKARLPGEEDVLSSVIKIGERRLQFLNVNVRDSFFISLLKHVEHLSDAEVGKNGGSVEVFQAEFQANSLLA